MKKILFATFLLIGTCCSNFLSGMSYTDLEQQCVDALKSIEKKLAKHDESFVIDLEDLQKKHKNLVDHNFTLYIFCNYWIQSTLQALAGNDNFGKMASVLISQHFEQMRAYEYISTCSKYIDSNGFQHIDYTSGIVCRFVNG